MIRSLLFIGLTLLPLQLFSAAPLRHVENRVFGPGEQCLFDVRYGFIHGGTAKLEVTDTLRIRGFLCHVIHAEALSNAALSLVFPVRDTRYSYVDVYGLFSLKIEKNVNEGSYHSRRFTTFDPEKQTATTMTRTFPTALLPQDVISTFYYFRLIDITDSMDINCVDNYKSYPLRIHLRGREKVKTPLGQFDCLILEPKLASEGIFLKAGKITLWVTDDKARIPVMMKFKLPYLGNITCLLINYRPGIIVSQEPKEEKDETP